VRRRLLDGFKWDGEPIQADALHSQRPCSGSSRRRSRRPQNTQSQPEDAAPPEQKPSSQEGLAPNRGRGNMGSTKDVTAWFRIGVALQTSRRVNPQGLERHQLAPSAQCHRQPNTWPLGPQRQSTTGCAPPKSPAATRA